MPGRTVGFVNDTRSQITQFLQFADGWSNLAEEYAAMTTNGTLPTLPDVEEVYGVGALTLAQYNAGLLQMQAIVDSVHVSAVRAKLYRLKR